MRPYQILFYILFTLKLCNQIDWSWWWVCSPIWMSICVTALDSALKEKK